MDDYIKLKKIYSTDRHPYLLNAYKLVFLCQLREFFGTSKVLELSHQETTKRQIKREAVIKMENMNYEFLLSIFKELTTELPEELIYRETDDFFELRSAETV